MAGPAARPVVAVVTAMDEYQTRLLEGAGEVLAEHGIPLLVHCDGPLDRGARSSLLVAVLREADPLGVIEVNSLTAEEQRELDALLATVDLPQVYVGDRRPGRACVAGDNANGFRPLLAHLLDERGVRRPVLLRGIPNHTDSIAREEIFRDELARRGMGVDEDLVLTGWFMSEPAYEAVWDLPRRRRDFDAIVALNDQSAVSAVAALGDAGLRVPEDVAVTGFDNDLVAVRWPGLTTVDQDLAEQGSRAAHLLLEQIAGGPVDREVLVPSRLVVRGSTQPQGTPAVRELDEAVRIAVSDKVQLAARDASLALSSALNYCWTVDQVVEAVARHLHRLGITRCFLALYDRRFGTDRDGGVARVVTHEAKVVLAYRDGQRFDPPADPVASRDLLPRPLAAELGTGMLVLQPLAVLDRPLGYLLFEQSSGSARVTALMRTELSRAIDAVLTSQELREHARCLEQLVDQRTRELQEEVATRRRTERKLQRANVELQRSAMRDGLTELANRTAFEEHLDDQWRQHLTDGGELALLMVDVDAFKAFNDHHGHLVGDEALRTVADCLARAVIGPDDLACRFGGEEFTVVLPRSGEAGARAVSERFRRMLRDAAVPHSTSPVGPMLTASIGVAVGVPHPDGEPSWLLDVADRALYEAKEAGRDRIVLRRLAETSRSSPQHPTETPAGPATVGPDG